METFFSPFRTVIFFLAISLIGIALIPKLSVNFTPLTLEPRLSVSYNMPRSSPEMVERLVTSPLENTLSQVSGIKKIKSTSRDNNGTITLEFEKGTDIEYKKFEVNTLLRNIYPKLPESVSYPQVNQYGGNEKMTKGPFLIYTINAPFAPFQIKSQTEEIIRKPLIQIPELERVDIRGARDLQLTVKLEMPLLLKYRINIEDVSQAISQSIGNEYPGLAITSASQQFFIRLEKELQDVKDIENIIVGRFDNTDLRIKDLGRVYMEEQEPDSFYRINGNNAITLSITPRDDVNRVVVAAEVKKIIENVKNFLPEGYTIYLERDDTEFLKKELDKIYKRTGLSVLILTLFIFVASRDPRYLLTIFVGIVVNLAIASIFVYALNVNIHLYSLAGITISFGLIMDNAIVMVDHLHRKRNSKIFVALLAASLTTIMALLASFLLPEEQQRNLVDFSKVVSINLGVSLLIALFFTPSLYYLLFKEKLNRNFIVPIPRIRRKVKWFRRYLATIHWIGKRRGWATFFLIWLFGFPIFFFPTRCEGQDWYNKTLGNEKYLENVRPWVDKITGASLRMFVRGVYEKMQYREPEQTKLYVSARMAYGNTLFQMNEVIRPFESFIKGYEGVDKFVTDIRSGQEARIEITFKKAYEFSAIPYQLKGELIARSLDWSGVNWTVSGVGQGFYTGSSSQLPSYRVEMRGYNFDELERQAQIMADKLLEHRRIQEVDINALSGWNERPMNEYVLTFNPEKMALSGTNQGDVIRMLRNMSKPMGAATQIPIDDRLTPVMVKTYGADEFSKFQMMEEALPLDTTRLVRVKDIAELQFLKTPNTINKEDRQYIRIVAFDYYGSAKFGGEYRDQILEEMKKIMPVGYSAKSQGWGFGWDKAKREYGLLLLLMVGIFFVCSILFENLKQPLWIMVSIPISFIGLFLIFSLFNFSFDQGGYAAFLMLGGLVVNAAIFVVNDLNNAKGKNYNRNIIKAVTGKAAPILLTIISTCLGLVPFVMQGQNEIFWFSLAIGTIGGLIFSLVAIFIYLPVFLYKRR